MNLSDLENEINEWGTGPSAMSAMSDVQPRNAIEFQNLRRTILDARSRGLEVDYAGNTH